MTEADQENRPAPASSPDDSPFATPAVEGMPYERGSEEEAAIERVLEKPARSSG